MSVRAGGSVDVGGRVDQVVLVDASVWIVSGVGWGGVGGLCPCP